MLAYATRLKSGVIEACEFFLPGGPTGTVKDGEIQDADTRAAGGERPWPAGAGSCWAGFAYFSYLMLNTEELFLPKSGRRNCRNFLQLLYTAGTYQIVHAPAAPESK